MRLQPRMVTTQVRNSRTSVRQKTNLFTKKFAGLERVPQILLSISVFRTPDLVKAQSFWGLLGAGILPLPGALPLVALQECALRFQFYFSHSKGANTADLLRQSGLRIAQMINGRIITTNAPPNSTEYQTVVLPVAICAGGIKLNTNANNEPKNPTPAIIHIVVLPPRRNGRSFCERRQRRMIAETNISIYITRQSSAVSCDNI